MSYRLYLRSHPDWAARATYVTHAPYAIAIRIDRYERWEAVNRALQVLIEDGTLGAILKRWL